QAEGDYVMIHSTKGKFLKEQTMKSFESGLPQDKFVRVHRSSIVNIEFISQIELYDKQSQLLKLKNGGQVRISLSGYKALKKTLGL
ncbi:MAG: LytTR family transcriptional regulator, partial [Prevotella sp.]|nr:LytTR family transcriptional regulator [Prevotella sp.]